MDFDNIELKERENYARSSLLIVQYTKDGLADLIELNLKLTGFSSFQNFVNHYQHELYHLCYHQVKCCQCSRNYKLPQEQLIHPKQLEVLFDKSGPKKAKHNAFRIGDFCCCLARQKLSTSALDVTLARCLLFYFCKEVFWYSSLKLQKTTLEEFLNQNKHTLYHLYDTSRRCCQCPPLYKFPTETELIDDSNWTELFSKRRMPCIRHKKRPIGKRNICSVSATPGILVSHLDPTISKILLEHCCALWKTIEKLILIRGTIFADVDEATIHENAYLEYKASLEYGIAVMARVCNKEHEVTEKLKRAEKRKIDEISIINTIRRQISCTGASRIIEQSSLSKHTNFKRQKLILRRRSTVEASEQTTSQEQTASEEHTEGTDIIYQRRSKSAKRSKIKSSADDTGVMKDPNETGFNIREKRLKLTGGKKTSRISYNKGTSNSETKLTTINDDIEIQGYQGVKDEGLYQLNIVCDNTVVDCIVDSRINKECKISVKEFNGCKEDTNHWKETRTIVFLKANETFLSYVKKKKSLLCQYLLNHIPSFAIDNRILVNGLYSSIRNNDVETARFVGWQICRSFLEWANLHVYDIWLASLCKCSRRKTKLSSWFCSMNVTIIILVPKPNREIVNNFSGIPVKQIAYHGEIFKEASAISEKRTNLLGRDLNIQCHIPGPLAEKLFNNHSRLTLICPSEIKSIHFQDKPQFLPRSCIQLYCYVKGAIPIGEKHFPSDLQGIPTDVIEGFPRFCSQTIRIGDSVTNLKVSGTIGGFCLFYGRQALLTCAHAMLDWNTLLSTGHQHHMQPESVHFETGDRMLNETLHCGRVVNHSFTHDNPRETSTDVAVIELDNGICVSEQDYVNTKGKRKIHHRELGLQSRNLHDGYIKTFQGLPGRNVEVVCAGAVSDFNSYSNTATVIKVPEWLIEREKLQSASHNLVKCITGNLSTQVDIPVHMQVHAIVSAAREEEVKSQRTLRFYNQLAVSNIPFQQGDSGACVYITDGYIESGCLGMAIADYPGGGCIVTPMATLLDKLGLI